MRPSHLPPQQPTTITTTTAVLQRTTTSPPQRLPVAGATVRRWRRWRRQLLAPLCTRRPCLQTLPWFTTPETTLTTTATKHCLQPNRRGRRHRRRRVRWRRSSPNAKWNRKATKWRASKPECSCCSNQPPPPPSLPHLLARALALLPLLPPRHPVLPLFRSLLPLARRASRWCTLRRLCCHHLHHRHRRVVLLCRHRHIPTATTTALPPTPAQQRPAF
mmetsp:Transcript_5709/g.11906  ORF Transcript_5709/g.11906 Transcript_5709/m.11906 type:complete len:218 (+) Transcript_5709:354-1007(+)